MLLQLFSNEWRERGGGGGGGHFFSVSYSVKVCTQDCKHKGEHKQCVPKIPHI